jgi:hypothetical protein
MFDIVMMYRHHWGYVKNGNYQQKMKMKKYIIKECKQPTNQPTNSPNDTIENENTHIP